MTPFSAILDWGKTELRNADAYVRTHFADIERKKPNIFRRWSFDRGLCDRLIMHVRGFSRADMPIPSVHEVELVPDGNQFHQRNCSRFS